MSACAPAGQPRTEVCARPAVGAARRARAAAYYTNLIPTQRLALRSSSPRPHPPYPPHLTTFAGLDTSQFYSVQRDEVYCKIRCPRDRMVVQADKINYKLLLDSAEAEKEMTSGRRNKLAKPGENPFLWKGRTIEDQFAQSPFGVYDYIYGEYNANVVPGDPKPPTTSKFPKLYKQYELENGVISEFNSIDRIKIIQSIFEGSRSDNCCGMDIAELVLNGALEGCYPLHNNKEKVMLEKRWLLVHQAPWDQPIWEVRSYFGEKVALFFAMLGHFNGWVLLPAAFGLFVYIDMAANASYTVESQFWFGLFLSIWAVLMLEFWKRAEVTLVMQWGMTGFEEEEPQRPDFEGEIILSPVNGEDETYFPDKERRSAFAKATGFLGAVVVLVTGLFASVFALGAFMNHGKGAAGRMLTDSIDYGELLPYMLCAGIINVVSGKFNTIGIWLTKLENHRTDTQFEDSVIVKTFVFEFFNSYGPCFYVIFLKAYAHEDACPGGCVRDLHYLLGCIFFTTIVMQNASRVWGPVSRAAAREAEERQGADPSKRMSAIEKQFMLEEYHPKFGAFKHFKELAVNFGYCVLFSTVFPLAPLLAWVSTYCEIRVQAWVLLQKSRRVTPSGVEDIGTWQGVFESLASIAVLTNMGILFVVSTEQANTTWMTRITTFLLYEHAIFMGQYLFAVLVDDVPAATQAQLDRQAFLHKKLIENVPDDDIEVVEGEDDDDALNVIDEIYDGDEDPVL